MITIENGIIGEIKVLEIVKKEQSKLELPTVFFYHGWESYKERVLEEAYILAKANFRVVLPDAFKHGERKTEKNISPLLFWEVVKHTIDEFPSLVDYYINTGKTNSERVGVSGLSMGGIITSGIINQYDWVHSAAVLMGSPSPVKFTEWLITNKFDEFELEEPTVKTQLKQLESISLNLSPHNINERAIYFWHDLNDNIVPAKFTKRFVEKYKGTHYGENLSLELSKGLGHKVPGEIIHKMTNFFEKQLKN